jgi:hypothetical protein
MHGRIDKYMQCFWCVNLKGRDCLGDLNIYVIKILKWNFEVEDTKMWAKLNWLRIGMIIVMNI